MPHLDRNTSLKIVKAKTGAGEHFVTMIISPVCIEIGSGTSTASLSFVWRLAVFALTAS
jgi:hypothetical protein